MVGDILIFKLKTKAETNPINYVTDLLNKLKLQKHCLHLSTKIHVLINLTMWPILCKQYNVHFKSLCQQWDFYGYTHTIIDIYIYHFLLRF